jgi:nicotinamide riboside transporter PnuC
MIFNIITVIITILSLIGVILNIKKNKICFIVWSFTNLSWFIIDLYKQIYMQAFLFLVYFILALYGIYEWSKRNDR